jgi:hypothetical protein
MIRWRYHWWRFVTYYVTYIHTGVKAQQFVAMVTCSCVILEILCHHYITLYVYRRIVVVVIIVVIFVVVIVFIVVVQMLALVTYGYALLCSKCADSAINDSYQRLGWLQVKAFAWYVSGHFVECKLYKMLQGSHASHFHLSCLQFS